MNSNIQKKIKDFVSLIIEVKVLPQSGKALFIVDKSGILKCFIKAAPEKGRANKEVIDVIAKKIGIAKSLISIICGATGRKKLIKIHADITYEQILKTLNSGIQTKIL